MLHSVARSVERGPRRGPSLQGSSGGVCECVWHARVEHVPAKASHCHAYCVAKLHVMHLYSCCAASQLRPRGPLRCGACATSSEHCAKRAATRLAAAAPEPHDSAPWLCAAFALPSARQAASRVRAAAARVRPAAAVKPVWAVCAAARAVPRQAVSFKRFRTQHFTERPPSLFHTQMVNGGKDSRWCPGEITVQGGRMYPRNDQLCVC